MGKARGVLETVATIRTAARDGSMARFMTGWVGSHPNEATTHGLYAPGQTEAQRRRDEDILVERCRAVAEDWSRAFDHNLGRSVLYRVDPVMIPLWRAASLGIPSEFEYHRDVAPAPEGFVFLPEPIEFRDHVGTAHVHAVSWEMSEFGYVITLWSDNRDATDDYMRAFTGQQRADIYRRCGRYVPTHIGTMKFGETVGGTRITYEDAVRMGWLLNRPGTEDEEVVREAEEAYRTHPVENPHRLVVALWQLLQQTVVDVREAALTPGESRLAARARLPRGVTLVTLRRTTQRRDGEPATVEWQHRWLVRGHWRKQPCGPGRLDTRLIWIAPHVKGPDDAPFVETTKIYDLSR